MELKIDRAVAERMRADLISEQDAAAVIVECEKTGQYLLEPATGRRIGHLQRGYRTCWVEYLPAQAGAFAVLNAYSHRMAILEEYGADAEQG